MNRDGSFNKRHTINIIIIVVMEYNEIIIILGISFSFKCALMTLNKIRFYLKRSFKGPDKLFA